MKQIGNLIGNLPFGYYLKKFGDWALGNYTEFDEEGHQTMAVAGVLSFDTHIQVNSLGSTDEYAK